MRVLPVSLLIMASLSLVAQSGPPQRRPRPGMVISPSVNMAEMALKQAAEQLGNDKKIYDRDLDVLRHLRTADEAMTDPMQPINAVQKAHEEVTAAKSLNPEFNVMQGVIKVQEALEAARRSPPSADFGRLRTQLRSDALGPATRVVARNGARVQEEVTAWIRIQELIAAHLRNASEITGESLRAAQQ